MCWIMRRSSPTAVAGIRHREVLIGGSVVIGFGAKVIGPSTIGSYRGFDQAGLDRRQRRYRWRHHRARRDRLPAGPGRPRRDCSLRLQGASRRQCDDGRRSLATRKLGMVVPVTASDLATVSKTLSENESLAAGYITLYQGNSATGASPGASPTLTGINSGDLAAILGANQQPGPTSASFEPAKSAPEFLIAAPGASRVGLEQFSGPNYRRRADRHAGRAGRGPPGTSQRDPRRSRPTDRDRLDRTHRPSRHDQFTAGGPAHDRATVPRRQRRGHSRADRMSARNLAINVTIGPGAVVMQTSLGSNSSVGPGAYLSTRHFPPTPSSRPKPFM